MLKTLSITTVPEVDKAESRTRLRAATILALAAFGFFMGFVWDIQWHQDVGPDSFFTGPHSLLYGSTAVAGTVSLYMLLRSTLRFRHGLPGVTRANTTPWLRRLRAPVGFIVAGLGAASFLLSGLFDLYWHTLYGFDVTLLSPPHFGLLLSGPVILVGALYAFASEANQTGAVGPLVGVVSVLALLFGQLSIFLLIPLNQMPLLGPIDLYAALCSLFFPAGLMVAAVLVRLPWAATALGLLAGALKLLILWYAPASVSLQAQVMGYAYRDNAVMQPIVGYATPGLLLVAGVIVDLGLRAGREWGLSPRLTAIITGVLSGFAYAWIDPKVGPPFAPVSFVVIATLAALSGWIGWRTGTVLRHTSA